MNGALAERPYFAAAVATVSVVAIALTSRALSRTPKHPDKKRCIPSPLESLLPTLSSSQIAALPYSPDLLPGARDVWTPYGSMRVYEWGPETGRKMLCVHGDATSAPIFGPIAEGLVKKGCRVMLMDLWGRGYSDTPMNTPHDIKLYVTQISFAINSSPICWGGPNAFSMVGFSMGGAITMSFASHFPNLVDSIVLLAPGGILRDLPPAYKNPCFYYPQLVPQWYLRRLVGSLLGVASSPALLQTGTDNEINNDQVLPEILEKPKTIDAGHLDVAAIVQWQFDHHQGFVHSFTNTIKQRIFMNQHQEWKRVCKIVKGDIEGRSKLANSKILAIFGEDDDIVKETDVAEDLSAMLDRRDHLVVKSVPGGHGFPIPNAGEVIGQISEFWGLA